MSFILDALRKSERERQHSLEGRLGSHGPAVGAARVRVPWALLAGFVLVVNAVVLLVVVWSRSPRPVSGTATRTAVVAPKPRQALTARGAIRPLAAEAADSTRPVPSSDAAGAAPKRDTAIGAARPAADEASPTLGTSPADIRPLEAMPEDFQSSLPKLHLDVHSYGDTPGSRFVVINMHRYREGDVLDSGPRVVRITPDGVILEFHGQPFLLPRP